MSKRLEVFIGYAKQLAKERGCSLGTLSLSMTGTGSILPAIAAGKRDAYTGSLERWEEYMRVHAPHIIPKCERCHCKANTILEQNSQAAPPP